MDLASLTGSADPTFMLLLLFGLPGAGIAGALFSAFLSVERTKARLFPRTPDPATRGRLMVLLTMLATYLVFAMVVALTFLDAVDPALWTAGALAYAVPAFLVGMGLAILFYPGVRAILHRPESFVRVVVLAAALEPPAISGLVVALTIAGLQPELPGSLSVARAISGAARYAALGGLAAPLGALFAWLGWDFQTPETWLRAVVLTASANVLAAISVSLALLTLGPVA